jgi:PAS domain S-box-containing protein
MPSPSRSASMPLFPAGGEMARLIEGHDWSRSPLGRPDRWPPALASAVRLILPSSAQIVLFWGPEYCAVYNDAYAPTIGEKHPRALGRPAAENWSELWDDLEPLLRGVRETGETLHAKDRPFYIERHGYGEQVYFDISYSAVRADDGSVGGVLCVVSETTERVRAQKAMHAERERLALMFDQAPGFMALLREPGHVFELTNASYQRLIGGREVIGRSVRQLLPELEGQGFFELLDRVAETGEPHTGKATKVTLRHAVGGPTEERLLDFVYQPIKDRDGKTTAIFIEGADVTEHFEAIAAQRTTEARFEAIANSIDQMLWSTRPDGHHDYYNDRWYDFTGAPYGSTDGEGWSDIFHPDDRERAWTVWRRSLATGEPYHIEYRLRHRSGEYRWVLGRAQPVRDPSGEIVRWYGSCTDIHDLKSAEDALRAESEALEILNATANRVSAELDTGALVQTVVDAGCELTGAQFGAFFYNVLDERGESYMLYAISGVDRSAFSKFPMPRNTAVFAPTFGGEGVVRSDDITADRRYGHNKPHRGMPKGHLPVRSYIAVPVVSRSGDVIGGLFFGHERPGVFAERSERLMVGLAAQAATGIDNARLFQRIQRLNSMLEGQVEARTAERDRLWSLSEDLLMTADQNHKLLSISPSWSRLLGYADAQLLGRSKAELIHPNDRATVATMLAEMRRTGRPASFENRLEAADGSWRWIAWTMVPDPGGALVHGIGRDVTEQRERERELAETEERLRQAQKMETVGQLTGGIAHDFNNLLQIVTGNVETLLRNLPQEAGRLRRAAEAAMIGATRAATLTQRLLVFSRRQPLAPKPIDANRLVAGMSELLHRSLGETIEVETVLASRLWRVEADPNQLENSVLNLAINARDAMPNGGKLTIETANVLLDHAYVAQHAEVTQGQYVVICISDTGEGMDADTVARAFEPFFTTKEAW